MLLRIVIQRQARQFGNGSESSIGQGPCQGYTRLCKYLKTGYLRLPATAGYDSGNGRSTRQSSSIEDRMIQGLQPFDRLTARSAILLADRPLRARCAPVQIGLQNEGRPPVNLPPGPAEAECSANTRLRRHAQCVPSRWPISQLRRSQAIREVRCDRLRATGAPSVSTNEERKFSTFTSRPRRPLTVETKGKERPPRGPHSAPRS